MCLVFDGTQQNDPDNIVAVHCKAGKGRTGLIIVCYLLYCGLHRKAISSRKFYDTQRCYDQKGLTIISQVCRLLSFFACATFLQVGVDT